MSHTKPSTSRMENSPPHSDQQSDPKTSQDSHETDAEQVRLFLRKLQDAIEEYLLTEDPDLGISHDLWHRAGDQGGGDTRVVSDGVLFEKAAVNFSDIRGDALPAAATERNPRLQGRTYRAMGVSCVIHPRNPHVPTTHLNVRYFDASIPADPIWWFGGGFDLTPFYPYHEDAVHWHKTARAACEPFGEHLYPRFKKWCDEYFYLPHRRETRGVGGIFFDDFVEGGFNQAFALMRSVGEHFLQGYGPIVRRRRDTPYGERERNFQSLRRGRYAEFNLAFDRGTRFGLQSGGRTESILVSLPPMARWPHREDPEPNSPEARLADFLQPRDWLGDGA